MIREQMLFITVAQKPNQGTQAPFFLPDWRRSGGGTFFWRSKKVRI